MALNAPYTPNTIIQSTQVSNDLTGLANGSNDTATNSMSTFRSENFFDFVASGCVWSGDAYASTRAASQTSGVIYLAGIRLTVAAVTARLFTASKDTYVDLNTSGVQVYTEVTNNAASPALIAGQIRIGIIITGASSIAAATSINQGQETLILPIASSIPYAVTDSLGNMICNRNPDKTVLGLRQITSGVTVTAPTSPADVTGLNVPFIAPGNRKVKVSFDASSLTMSAAGSGTSFSVYVNDTTSGFSRRRKTALSTGQNWDMNFNIEFTYTPAAGLNTLKIQVSAASGNVTVTADGGNASTTSAGVAALKIELM